jgi:hypothetical protein
MRRDRSWFDTLSCSGVARQAVLAVVVATKIAAQQVTASGIVRDSATSRTLSGALVQIAGATRSFTTRSDEAGEFFVSGVEPGDFKIVVRRIGYAPYAAEVRIGSDRDKLEIRLVAVPQALKPVTVRGEGTGVYGEVAAVADLKPVVGARVQVAGSRQTVTTDSTGTFFVPLSTPGTFVVRITANGYAPEFFTIPVKRDEVADGSRLLSASDGRLTIPEGLWKDFDQRLSWRSPNHSVLASGSEVRRAGASMRNAVEALGPVVAKGFRLGSSVCVFVDGSPRPGYPLNAIRTEEVKAIEVYGRDREVGMFLGASWPMGARCSETGASAPRGAEVISWIVIWTR